MGDVTYVQTSDKEKHLEAGDVMATIESVKAAIDFYTPLAGRVVATNSQLVQTPELLTQDPEGEGWMLVIELDRQNPTEAILLEAGLLSSTDYAQLIDYEAKDQ